MAADRGLRDLRHESTRNFAAPKIRENCNGVKKFRAAFGRRIEFFSKNSDLKPKNCPSFGTNQRRTMGLRQKNYSLTAWSSYKLEIRSDRFNLDRKMGWNQIIG